MTAKKESENMISDHLKKSVFFILAFLIVGLGQGCSSRNQDTAATTETEEEAVETQAETAQPSAASVRRIAGAPVNEEGVFRGFSVYSDGDARGNHYVPSGWMGDYEDIKINEKSAVRPHGGANCIRVEYSNKASQGARWAGIYWQNPPNNWGTRPGGYDLTGAKKLTFWVRGEKGGEKIDEFKIGGITGDYSDTDVVSIGPIDLTTEWKQYTIRLEEKNLSSISGGFCWAANLDANPDGCIFYLDDIKYE